METENVFKHWRKFVVNFQYSHWEELIINQVFQRFSTRLKPDKAMNSEKTDVTDDAKVSQGSEGWTGYKKLHLMILGDTITAESPCK